MVERERRKFPPACHAGMWQNRGTVVILGLSTGWGDCSPQCPDLLTPKKEEAPIITGV